MDKTTLELIGLTKTKKRNTKRIRCVETGEVFNSINEAARKLNISYPTLYYSIQSGGKFRGITFEYID